MSLPDDYLRIYTPENVIFDYEVAGIGSRFLAALVDTLLIIVLQIVVNLVLILSATVLFGALADWDSIWLAWLAAVLGLISFLFLWGYYVFFELTWNGQSPGKRWTGLRVIRADGTPITLAESVIRNLVRLVDFLPLYYGVGVVTMFINPQARRLGDLAAGTLVVRDRPTVTLESLAAGLVPAGLPQPVVELDLPVERLSNRDIQLAEDFLRRRSDLAPDSRRDIAQRIAQTLLKRMDVPPERVQGVWDEQVLLLIVLAGRRRGGQAGASGR